MHLYFRHQDQLYTFDARRALDLALPLRAGSENPNCYYAPPVAMDTIRMGSFVGSVAEGGPCNYQQLSLAPHGNGTHTECYGHLSADPQATIWHTLRAYLFVARLISVPIRSLADGDQVVALADVQEQMADDRPEALVIRTLPNGPDKRTRQYSGTNPPYLEAAIGHYLAALGVKHLLVDLPSVDRESDGGRLSAHRGFWGITTGNGPAPERREATITELVYADPTMADGRYLLQLQVAPLCADASPSRPVLYPVAEATNLPV